jgi:4-alpha-glucanotransferase
VSDSPHATLSGAAEAAHEPSRRLTELAGAHGVATDYWNWQGEHVVVPATTIVAVLAAMGVDARSEDAVEAALAEHELAPWRRLLPPVVVVRSGSAGTVAVHVPDGDPVELVVRTEDGGRLRLHQTDQWVAPRTVDGTQVGEATFELPADLPLGWHELQATSGSTSGSAPLVVTPDRLELPEALGSSGHRWGLMAQLYSVRSERSWGLGDFADLGELLDWSGRDLGADFLLVNPLLAAEPVGHVSPSPYLPTTRRFTNPIYLRVEDIREFAYLPSTDRSLVEWQAEALRATNTDADVLDRDAVWAAKRSALKTVFAAGRSHARQAAFEAFCAREGSGLADYALWCALVEHFGAGEAWPQEAHDPRSPLVAQLREELAGRIEFHQWLQWLCDEQLAHAQQVATDAGMALGVMHDLAVGVHPEGADSWALQDVLAKGVSVGAPPDDFNQQGQDWSQPPWQPVALAEAGYAPWRDMVRTILRHGGGLRVDHVLGLFRLWWVPAGGGPAEGTYVRYDHDALVGILCLEAHRAGAVVVGEDLGVVEPWVRGYLQERGVLGTSVLWFERDENGPLPPERWRELCLATVNTHDLPPTAGYLAGEHVDLRDRLGLLTRPVEEERAADQADQAAVLDQLRRLGLLREGAPDREVVEALHAFLLRTPSRLVGVALADAVGERRTQNQPGTSDEYPNWQVPLADGAGEAVLVDDLRSRADVRSLASLVAGRRIPPG